jgi:hypothetical protein
MQKSDKIKIETETGQTLDVVVTSFSAEAIWILIGEGTHSSKCKLEPTRNGLAFAGSVMGREIIYPRSVKDVREELARKVRQGGGFRK